MSQSFDQFLAVTSANIPILEFLLNIILSAFLSIALSWIYARYGNSLSNRKEFGRNFLPIAMTTMLIITIVKSSLALSLGLVGALSIVRFRTAIKEPEELTYLFLTIAIGLGLGANQAVITIIALMMIIIALIITRKVSTTFHDNQNLHLTIQSNDPKNVTISQILDILKRNCSVVDLKRLDEAGELLEVSFLVEFGSFTQLNKSKEELQKLNNSINITFMDNKGLI